MSNDFAGARIVAVNGNTWEVGKWINESDGGQFRVFEFGQVQFREVGRGIEPDGYTEFSYTISAPGASGETLTSTFGLDLFGRPSEVFAGDDDYTVTPGALTDAGGDWITLGGVDEGLLANDFAISEITQINGVALQEGVAFDGTNGGQFRVNSDGSVEFLNTGPDTIALGDTTSFIYMGDQGNSATASLVVEGERGGPALPSTFGATIRGVNLNDQSGRYVSSAGDINNDGYDDVLIGTNISGIIGENTAHIVDGAAQGITPNLELLRIDGTNGVEVFGLASATGLKVVASAGDVNDILIGAPHARGDGNFSGETYVVLGMQDELPARLDEQALDGTNGFVLRGIGAFGSSGFSVSSAGDFNGDGIADILIGARPVEGNAQKFVG